MASSFSELRTVSWKDGTVVLIDQTKLPNRLSFCRCSEVGEVALAIRNMVVRGAPAIGVTAAMGLALVATRSKASDKKTLLKDLEAAAELLRATRPTAVNLQWGLERIIERARSASADVEVLRGAVVDEAVRMGEEDVEANRSIGRFGAELVDDGDVIMTHCNAGALATVGYGTAQGIMRAAKEQGKRIQAFVLETRPALQGSRLTAYELLRDGFHVTVLADTAAGYVMSRKMVGKVIVGADRILSTGHVFNKIGTYQLAVLAQKHGIPLICAAPSSTFDLKSKLTDVEIEQRSPDEVVKVRGKRIAPKGVQVLNPAFDVTPPELIYAISTELGLIRPVSEERIRRILRQTLS